MSAEQILNETAALLSLRAGSLGSLFEFTQIIRRGLPARALVRLAKELELTEAATVKALGLAQRTLARRLSEKKPLTTEESERVVRLARVFAEAKYVLGNETKARNWLKKPSRALGGVSPLSLLDTDIGAGAVLEELGRIEYGVFA